MAKTELTIAQKPDYAQLLTLLTKVAGNIAYEKANVTAAYKALIGELGNQPLPEGAEEGATPNPHTVVSYIAQEIAKVNGAATELAGKVQDNKDAIDLLNNNAQTEGSVLYMIDQAFNDFTTKVSDDKVVNTFKELLDYAATHQGEYTELVTLVGSLPADAGVTTIVAYIEKLVAAEKSRAEGVEGDLQDAIDDINNAETGILKQAKDYADTKKSEAISAVQGETENTVKDLEDAFLADHSLTEEQMSTLLALFPTE